jgi:hypothetical protein
MTAKKEIDEAITELFNLFMNFDLADMLSRVGTNNDFGSNWVHSVAYLKIRYPVDDYVRYMHEYLQLAENSGELVNGKKEVLAKINEILNNRYNELVELYRRHLIAINNYKADTFTTDVEDIVHRAGRYEVELKKQMRGVNEFASYYNKKWDKTIDSMVFPEDSVEHSVMAQLQIFRGKIDLIERNFEDYNKNLAAFLSELENSIAASKFLTSTQIRQIRSYINLIQLISVAIETVKIYLRTKALADELAIRYSKDQSKVGVRLMGLTETELLPLYKTAGVIMTRAETEIKMSEHYIPSIKIIRKNVENRFKGEAGEAESIQRLIAQKESEEKRIKGEISKVWLDFNGKKKVLEKNLRNLQTDLITLRGTIAEKNKEIDKIKDELDKMTQLEKSLEAASQYRKYLNYVYNKTNELNSMLSVITSTNNYYERVVELSEAEQVKIMDKILREEESKLKGEGILK